MTERIPITEAARQLGLDYQQCRRLVLRGDLPGGRDEYGRLFVKASAVRRAVAKRNNPRREAGQRRKSDG